MSALPQTTIKRFKYDFSVSPDKRWGHIIGAFKESIPFLKTQIDNLLTSMQIGSSTLFIVRQLIKLYKKNVMYYSEMESLSILLDISVEKLMLMQLCYEYNSMCTSVGTRVNGKNIHYRTMDWELDFLKDITIELEYIKDGQSIALATTWLGYIGVLTGVSNQHFSISVNFRLSGDRTFTKFMTNVWNVLSLKWPIGYLVRDIFETNCSYEEALVLLRKTILISPTYFTVCHNQDNPIVIVRNPANVDIERSGQFVVQTNADNNKSNINILHSLERIELTEGILNNNNNFNSVGELFDTFNKHPIINEETVYISIMDPINFTLYTTLNLQ